MANFYISNKDWRKIQNYARYAWDEYKSEIGGFLIAEQDKDNKWKMHKPVILKQEISGGNTVLDKDALAEYYVKTAMKMKKKPFQFVWWHSHHTMSVFWSSTDLAAIEEYSSGTMSVSLVVNLDEEYKLRVNLWKPYKMHKDVEMDIIDKPNNAKVPKAITTEVDKLCEEPVKAIVQYNRNWEYGAYNYRVPSGQLSVFKDGKKDDEMVQIEARLDNILLDYITNLDYNKYLKDVTNLNSKLRKAKSELRVGVADEEHESMLFEAMSKLTSDEWIYPKHESWSFVDKCIEYDFDHEVLDVDWRKYDNTKV